MPVPPRRCKHGPPSQVYQVRQPKLFHTMCETVKGPVHGNGPPRRSTKVRTFRMETIDELAVSSPCHRRVHCACSNYVSRRARVLRPYVPHVSQRCASLSMRLAHFRAKSLLRDTSDDLAHTNGLGGGLYEDPGRKSSQLVGCCWVYSTQWTLSWHAGGLGPRSDGTSMRIPAEITPSAPVEHVEPPSPDLLPPASHCCNGDVTRNDFTSRSSSASTSSGASSVHRSVPQPHK